MWVEGDSGMLTPRVVKETVESLVEALFSLDEPWRGRFLSLVATWATGGTWNGRRPRREEVTAWLAADTGLCRVVRLMLNSWQRP